jgi:porin
MLGQYGVSLGLQETSEIFGNATGGTRQGAAYDGLTMLSLGVDTEKAFGWAGGTFNISALQIHGRNLSAENLGSLQTASGIEAQRATRLWELWYQQSFLGGKVDVKLGQQSLDQEFITSTGSGLFINTAMGWPVLPSVDQYAGGPAYPLSSLGVRLRVQPTDTITVLAGVFDDNPPGGTFFHDSALRGASQSGTAFNTGTGALFIGEVQYALNPPPADPKEGGTAAPTGLPGVYKAGFWYDTGRFYDQRWDNTGLSLANPNSSGDPRSYHGNVSLYGVADQMIWRPSPDGPQALGVFARLMGAPGGRNQVSFSVNAGLTLKAPLPGRDNDTLGLGFGMAKISHRAIQLDQDYNALSPTPIRSSETFIELTYQYQVAPWWTLQPDFQYVFLPGGGVANPASPGTRIGNEAIFGLRTVIVF